MNLTLQFLLMVDGPIGRDEIVDRIQTCYSNVVPCKSNSCKLQDNLIEVWMNPNADNHRATDPVEGYLFYAYRVECTPLNDMSEFRQVELAKQLLAVLLESGWKVVPCANFEDQL